MRNFNPKFQSMRFHILLPFSIVFWSCSEPADIEDSIKIENRQFNYHQDVNQLYFAMEVESKYNDQSLSDAKIVWYALSRNNTPDTLNLYDNGLNGDIIMGDGLYGLKINNELVTDETKIINKDNFNDDYNIKISHGKKRHVIIKIT